MRLTVVVAGIIAAGVNAPLVAQSDSTENVIVEVVHRLFDAMRSGDSAAARSAFHPDAQLIATFQRDGVRQVRITPIDRFIEALGVPHEQEWDERIWDMEVRLDDGLATVWTHYAFYLGEAFSHCGVDAFQLARGPERWEIVSLADTRRQVGCREAPGDR